MLAEFVVAMSRRPVTGSAPLAYLAEAATAAARHLDVSAAVLVVPGPGWARGSDEVATLVGELQQRDGQGPAFAAARSNRLQLTADLTRVGPPALAALAGEEGLQSSAAVPLAVDGRVVGVLQLLGRAGRRVTAAHTEALGAAGEVLAARIVDLVELARPASEPAGPVDAPPGRHSREAGPVAPATRMIPAVPAPRPAADARPTAPGSLATATPELVTQELRAVRASAVRLRGRRAAL